MIFYECNVCRRKHAGTERTPATVKMVPTKATEWVFVCWPSCDHAGKA